MTTIERSGRTADEIAAYRKVTWRLLRFLMLCYERRGCGDDSLRAGR